ncbi:MAG: alpha/beta hydrolase [Actinomycetota bacterium]
MTSQLTTGASRRTTIAVPGGRLAGLRSGRTDDPAVLLVPGYTGSKEDFGPIMSALAGAELQAIAIDQRGQYESAGPAEPAAYTPNEMAVDLLAIADEVGRPVHLVGHSYGGLVSRAAVIAEPTAFRSLTLMSSGPAAIGGRRRVIIDQLRPLLPAGLGPVYDAMQAAYAGSPGYVVPPAPVAQFLRARFLLGSPAMLEGMGDALVDEPDRVAELAATAVPTLVLTGADDDAWPPHVQADMARRLGARYQVIAGARHSPAVENPAGTAQALIDFWRDVP